MCTRFLWCNCYTHSNKLRPVTYLSMQVAEPVSTHASHQIMIYCDVAIVALSRCQLLRTVLYCIHFPSVCLSVHWRAQMSTGGGDAGHKNYEPARLQTEHSDKWPKFQSFISSHLRSTAKKTHESSIETTYCKCF